jgi:PBP1b-binding outer membrane lipoprotein LpoB
MSFKSFIPFALICLALFAGGCAYQGRVAVDSEDPFISTTTDSKDIETIVQEMARSIVTVPQIANAQQPPTIAFASMVNKGPVPLDTEMLLEDIRTLLINNAGNKMVFLNRAKAEEVYRERESKRAGEITASTKKAVLGADYFLTGTIRSLDKTDGSMRSTYIVYNFNLTDAESMQIVWENSYKTKKVGKKGLYDM